MEKLLAPFMVATLDADPSSICALTDDLRIAYVNPARTQLARANQASSSRDVWGEGCAVLDAVPAVLQDFYQALFARSLAMREVVTHEYDCSSPEEHRRMQMRVHPCTSGGLLVVHSPLRVGPPEWPASSEPDCRYQNETGIATICAHCRRVRRADDPATWEWVPRMVQPRSVVPSHGLCPICSAYHYPGRNLVNHPGEGQGHVLVVDDDEALRRVIARVLRREGYSVLEARDGAGALAIVRAGVSVDAVLSDITMPGEMDGLALTAELSRLRPGSPLILMSGAEVSNVGSDVLFLAKPFSPSSLLAIVKHALRRR